jgi:hypothetical protein
LKVTIGINKQEKVEHHTSVYSIEFSGQELAMAGKPPRKLMMSHERNTFIYNPAINPDACNLISYKLLQLAWLSATVEAGLPKERSGP